MGEGNARERWKTTRGLISKETTLHVQHTFLVHFFAVVLHDYKAKLFFYGGNVVRVLVHFSFFTTAHFLLALVAASISHFVTAATKLSCYSSRSRSLSPFFSAAYFLFFSVFLFPIFQTCRHDNLPQLNTLDNTDSETISAFRFRLYWLFSCLCFTLRRGWLCDFAPK